MTSLSRPGFLRASAAALAAGALAPRAAEAQTLTPLTFAAIPSDIAAQAWYGVDSGIFRKHGLDVKVLPILNGAAISAAVLGGSVDIGYSNVISLVAARTRGLPVMIIAPANLHVSGAPTAGIMAVKRSSTIQSGKDLNGKVVAALGINNISQISAKAWIDKTGGDSSTVKYIEMPFAEMVPALLANRIDVAEFDAGSDPTVGHADDQIRRIGSAFDSVALRFAPSVWFTTSAWIAKHPKVARDVVAALAETAAWANSHHKESAVMLARVTKQTPEQIEAVTRVTYGDKVTPELVQPNVDAALKYGVIKEPYQIGEMISNIAR